MRSQFWKLKQSANKTANEHHKAYGVHGRTVMNVIGKLCPFAVLTPEGVCSVLVGAIVSLPVKNWQPDVSRRL